MSWFTRLLGREVRQSSLTDTVVNALLQQASTGATASTTTTAAVGVGSGFVGASIFECQGDAR